jgi:RNA polymerase sigma-70 factor (ECF subfamily)
MFQGDGSKFRAWVFTIAHHAAVDDARRRQRRVREVPLERAPEVGRADVEDQALARSARDRVDALLADLAPDQRDVLVLRFVSDLTISETAAVLGKSVEAVKALQHRAIGALRRADISREPVSP